jgi:hypothetical protein
VTTVAVAAGTRFRGFDGTDRIVPDAYEVVELREALERTYTTDAHLVSYVVRGRTRQPRINKEGLPYFDGIVETTAFFCDVDNDAHGAWTDDLVARAMREYATIAALDTCGVYHTAHGRRVVQPLLEPIPVAQSEPYLRRWLLSLECAGLRVDWACKDWTRHFRLPHVVRDGRPYRSPFVALDRMRPIALEPIAAAPAPVPTVPRGRRVVASITWSNDLPPHWSERAVAVAKAIRTHVTENWHEMYLALAGALLSRGCPPERVPAMVEWIALAAGSEKPASHRKSACDTARRYVAKQSTTGFRSLRDRWPLVANALEEVTPTRADARLREQAKPSAPILPLAEATACLTRAIREAPDGLTVISAECGLGKTNAAIGVAVDRAAKPYASPDAIGARAPLGSKTAISVDKNKLAEQIAADLRARGTPVRRIFGPLSVLREDGTPECRFHEVARPLVAGGQPMQWELCQGRGLTKCEFYANCRARDGVEGPDDARVTVGPHALLSNLDAEAGTTGLLIIDEPPPPLETIVLSAPDLADARQRLESFEGRYALRMARVLDAFDVWRGEETVHPIEVIRAHAGDNASDIVNAVQLLDAKAPPIRHSNFFVAKRSITFATQLGNASRVLGALRHAVASTGPVAVRVEKRGLVLTWAREDLAKALQRDGAVVVTDANAEIHVPVYEKIIGGKAHVHRFAADDGAPIARTLLRCSSANRTGWFEHGRVNLDSSFVAAVRGATQWAGSSRSVGIITMRVLRVLLEAAWRPDDEALDDQWRELGQPKEDLAEGREKLGPILQRYKGEIQFGHYGAVRGLNTMADVDALITLGDPWQNLGDVQSDVAFLGLEEDWRGRMNALCRAELEQAQGRLRPVHRKRPGRALHVGSIVPSGSGWGHFETTGLSRGPHRAEDATDASALRAQVDRMGGLRAAARHLGCSHTMVRRYLSGECVPPSHVVAKLPVTLP